MKRDVIIGASVPSGVRQLELFSKLKMGECVLTLLPMDKAEALAVARYCREHQIVLYFSEVLLRGTTDVCAVVRRKIPRDEFHSKAEMDEIIDAAGPFYGGRMTLGEVGGVLYWLKTYTLKPGIGEYANLGPVRTVAEARDTYVAYLKRFLQFERREIGKGPLFCVDSCLVFKYLAQAGVDILSLESHPGDPHLMQAALRGAARAYAKPWGTHIAMGSYGGVRVDELWQKRWKTSLYYCYITGAGFIWPESGHYTYALGSGQKFGFHSKEMKRVRRTIREGYQFSRVHSRPPVGPRVSLGVVHGNLDGAPGMWNKYVWGQYRGRQWREGPAEAGWQLVDKFHRREDWPKESVQGPVDFSGNPPYGQYDIVPIEASLKHLKSYRCLIFLAWNTMTPAIYKKLKGYVKSGGHLVMYLPHLSTHTDRADDLKLFRGGDFRDLFGVKVLGKGKTDVMGIKCMAKSTLAAYKFPYWRTRTDPRFIGEITPARLKLTTGRVLSGHDDFYYTDPEQVASRPLLVENSLGKGKAFLVAVWQYPGDEGIRPFTEDLIRTVLAGEQGAIRLLASDRVRYAVYDGALPRTRRRYSVVYLLNTDPDHPAPARLWIRRRTTGHFEIPANDLRIAYCCGDLVLIPSDRRVDLRQWTAQKTRHQVELYSVCNQKVEVHNLAARGVLVSINGKSVRLARGARTEVRLPRTVDAARKKFFAVDFLEEPRVRYEHARTPG